MAKNTTSQVAGDSPASTATTKKRTRTPRQLTPIEEAAKAQWKEAQVLGKFIAAIPGVSAWGLVQIEKAVDQRKADMAGTSAQ